MGTRNRMSWIVIAGVLLAAAPAAQDDVRERYEKARAKMQKQRESAEKKKRKAAQKRSKNAKKHVGQMLKLVKKLRKDGFTQSARVLEQEAKRLSSGNRGANPFYGRRQRSGYQTDPRPIRHLRQWRRVRRRWRPGRRSPVGWRHPIRRPHLRFVQPSCRAGPRRRSHPRDRRW